MKTNFLWAVLIAASLAVISGCAHAEKATRAVATDSQGADIGNTNNDGHASVASSGTTITCVVKAKILNDRVDNSFITNKKLAQINGKKVVSLGTHLINGVEPMSFGTETMGIMTGMFGNSVQEYAPYRTFTGVLATGDIIFGTLNDCE